MAAIKELPTKLKAFQTNENHITMGEEKKIQQELNRLLEKKGLEVEAKDQNELVCARRQEYQILPHLCHTKKEEKFHKRISIATNQIYSQAEDIDEAFHDFFH